MIRHLVVPWPDGTRFRELGRPLRILALSDDEDPALEVQANRDRLQPVDLVVGCGDLAPDYLGFIADSLHAPLAYIRGNHDRGAAWLAGADRDLPPPIPPAGIALERTAGVRVLGLGWPGVEHGDAQPSDRRAWLQSVRAAIGQVGRREPLIVISHVPPEGLGDMPGSNYHRGFGGYRWLLERLRPALWLHGHVHPAATQAIVVHGGTTPVINVTGATLLDLDPTARVIAPAGRAETAAAAAAREPATPAGASEARP